MMNNYKILVVDDDEQVLEVVKLALETNNYIVETASTAEEALNTFDYSDFDIVLSDIKMPGMSGVQLALKLIEGKFKGGIILMTGYPGEYKPEEVLELGIDAYLLKPFKIDMLFTVVAQVLKKKIE